MRVEAAVSIFEDLAFLAKWAFRSFGKRAFWIFGRSAQVRRIWDWREFLCGAILAEMYAEALFRDENEAA